MSWQQVQDEQGRTYFYNPNTQETSWKNPEDPTQWKTFTTEDGKEYYYNESTGETTWDKPQELRSPEQENAPEEAPQPTAEETSQPVLSDQDKELEAQPIVRFSPSDSSTTVESKPSKPHPEESDDGGSDVKDQKQEAYFRMLKNAGVDATWSFEKVIQSFVQNPAYWQIDDAVVRRDLYEEYLVKKIELESSNEVEMIDTFKNNFLGEIKRYYTNHEIKDTTRWTSVKSKLIREENPIFKNSILPDTELENIYNHYLKEVVREKNERLQSEKKQALAELEGYLLQITGSDEQDGVQWEVLYEKLQKDARFKANKHFRVLTKVDLVDLYTSKVYPAIVGRIKNKIAVASQKNRRSDMRARDQFRALLSGSKIKANTKFGDLGLDNEDAFMELCGRNGSNPLELFWDVVEEKKQSLKVKKDLVERALKDSVDQGKVQRTYEDVVSGEDFVSVLKSTQDERISMIDLNSTDGTDEAKVIQDMLRGDLESHRKKVMESLEETLRTWQASLADWISNNVTTLSDLITQTEESKIVPSDTSLDAWEPRLQSVAAFQSLSQELERHYGPRKNEHLAVSLEKSLHLAQDQYQKRIQRKRHVPDSAFGSAPAKKGRTEEKAPVLMNY